MRRVNAEADAANRPGWNLLTAAGLILLVAATEYFARRFAIFWLPVLGRLRVNDMLISGAGYAALVWLTAPPVRRSPVQVRRVLGEIWAFRSSGQVQAAAALVLGAGWLSYVDRFLWGQVSVPSLESPWVSDVVWLEPAGLVLGALSLLAVNGVVVPLAEEWLWRGLIQPRLTHVFGYFAGLGATSVMFSFKHVLIDASLGRFLTLTVFGLVMGWTAARFGWKASALAHAAANTLATGLGLVLSGGAL